MSGIKDLRDFLAVLKDNKLLFETERAVDWKYEIGSLLATLEQRAREPVYFTISRIRNSLCAEMCWHPWTALPWLWAAGRMK